MSPKDAIHVALMRNELMASVAVLHTALVDPVFVEDLQRELVKQIGFEAAKQFYADACAGARELRDLSRRAGLVPLFEPLPWGLVETPAGVEPSRGCTETCACCGERCSGKHYNDMHGVDPDDHWKPTGVRG